MYVCTYVHMCVCKIKFMCICNDKICAVHSLYVQCTVHTYMHNTKYRIAETLPSIKFGESVPRTSWRVLNLAP